MTKIAKYNIMIATLAVTKVMSSSICTYRRCKTCEIIKETNDNEAGMFFVKKKSVSELDAACDIMLRN